MAASLCLSSMRLESGKGCSEALSVKKQLGRACKSCCSCRAWCMLRHTQLYPCWQHWLHSVLGMMWLGGLPYHGVLFGM